MSKKKPGSGIVYSTNPDFKWDNDAVPKEVSLPAAEQKPVVLLDTKHRAGKMVTVVANLQLTAADLEDMSRKMKVLCGTGGSTKDGEVLIQGDHRDKILQHLLKLGYKQAKKR